jgi:very-short-patch-repair endonuclease
MNSNGRSSEIRARSTLQPIATKKSVVIYYTPPSRRGGSRRSSKCNATLTSARPGRLATSNGTTHACVLLAMPKRDHNLINIPPLKSRRKELRNSPTPAEALLWRYLQRRQLLGKKFRRQYGIGRYIVDFFCVDCDIAVELDGAPHFGELGEEYEATRTAFLGGLGIEVIRFENSVVFQNTEAVLDTIREAIRRRGV